MEKTEFERFDRELRDIYLSIVHIGSDVGPEDYQRQLELISVRLGFEYGCFRVPIFLQASSDNIPNYKVGLATYMGWNGTPVTKALVENQKYTNHTAYAFDRQKRLWIVPTEKFRKMPLDDCPVGEYLNIWKEGHFDKPKDLPRAGNAAKKDDVNYDKLTSVILPMGDFLVMKQIEVDTTNSLRAGVGIFEATECLTEIRATPEVKRILLKMTYCMLQIYLRDFQRSLFHLKEEHLLNLKR